MRGDRRHEVPLEVAVPNSCCSEMCWCRSLLSLLECKDAVGSGALESSCHGEISHFNYPLALYLSP